MIKKKSCKMNICVWLREDLRMENHKILEHCKSEGFCVSILITLSPFWWVRHGWGPNRQFAYQEAVKEVWNFCKAHHIPCAVLSIESATVEGFAKEVTRYLENFPIDCLAFTPQYETREYRRDQKIEIALQSRGRSVLKIEDGLVPFGAVLNSQALPFGVFTPFKNKARLFLDDHAPWSPPILKPLLPNTVISSQGEELLTRKIQPSSQIMLPITRSKAIEKFKSFCERSIQIYNTQRDIMASDGTSQLSAALSLGTIGAGELWSYLRSLPVTPGLQTFQNELLWREFYKHMIYHHPRLSKSQPYQNIYAQTRWDPNPSLEQLWSQGQTGFPLIDAAMNQLRQEGWQHNRMRMLTAIFFTKILLQPWQNGEKFFAYWLVDYNLSANNGGWQWSASTGVDPVPYFRIMSPWEQTRKFDPDGQYIRTYCPDLQNVPADAFACPLKFRKAAPRYIPFCVDYADARKRALAYYKEQRL